jgi:hypothetical protein
LAGVSEGFEKLVKVVRVEGLFELRGRILGWAKCDLFWAFPGAVNFGPGLKIGGSMEMEPDFGLVKIIGGVGGRGVGSFSGARPFLSAGGEFPGFAFNAVRGEVGLLLRDVRRVSESEGCKDRFLSGFRIVGVRWA